MLETRLDTIDFGPRLPVFGLALACLAFGALGLIFALDTRNAVTYGMPVTGGFIAERVIIALMLLSAFSFITLLMLLPLRLRFTEEGIRRRTILGPRFIPWGNVTAARLGSFKGGNITLELKVKGRRLPVIIPLADYRRPATLLAELRRRLPVEVQDIGNFAARLEDE